MADLVVQTLKGLDPMEQNIVVASTDRRISDYGSAELAAALNSFVKWVALDAGVKLSETDMTYTIVRMAEMLNRHYGYLTIKEVRYAFELVLTGDLDEFLPKREGQPDRSAYGAFNMSYVCKVLNAYHAMRSAAIKRYRDNLPTEDHAPSEEEERRAAQEIRDKLKSCYRNFVENETFVATLIEERLYYDLLAEMGYMDKVNQPSARDIEGALSAKGKDAPYARERRSAIIKCFTELRNKGIEL